MEQTIIAMLPEIYSGIEIQLIFLYKGENCFINSVNIIYKKKIIQKIKPKGILRENTPENIELIISSFFSSKLRASTPRGSSIKNNAQKRAASDLMNEFNI